MTNFDQNLSNDFAQPSSSRAMIQHQYASNLSSILNQTNQNVSPMQTDDLLMSIFNYTSSTDYDPTDNFSDIK